LNERGDNGHKRKTGKKGQVPPPELGTKTKKRKKRQEGTRDGAEANQKQNSLERAIGAYKRPYRGGQQTRRKKEKEKKVEGLGGSRTEDARSNNNTKERKEKMPSKEKEKAKEEPFMRRGGVEGVQSSK